MRLIIGVIVVFACVFGGYSAMGGHVEVLWQPFEFVIILGAAIGAFIIGNTGPVLKAVPSMFGTLIKGPKFNKAAYVELLGVQFAMYKLIQQKGILGIEPHIEDPHNSTLFNAFPSFAKNHHAVEFVCDYMRMVTMGSNNVHEMDALMDEELETHHQEQERIVSSMQSIADGTPALGIVAAVLGVIKTMGAITEPPEVLGHLIGGALVGTFFGVFVAYGFFGPMAQSLKNIFEAESKYYLSLKVGLLAHIGGQPPVMAVEFARKALMSEVRPTFAEVEAATANLPATA
ncbi:MULTISPECIES: flagellar motor stator protein MotA [Devosia]|uniref:Motility protein A n=1 Tax=Devosia equisanguinis TaxID=2490941 RepID=A0A3S5D3F0_9HYPH|nr:MULTISPECIES: flagellar motor stator protein MotA [Devosia]ODT50505.1 MAG: flagellar motor stator protein MotA [Pelagibacterium sp. SCN 63-126]ODU88588.1 MAG: flagellar motor stator protein MotA [Pelagibacterium sp. SCN 63-17]OJX45544.1 MAG: flagellar motor stator protein MotA [Devosia sp. 63-57]VDS04818.1 Motility protein A [Devosia equisanguinis]